jgi:predicted nucleotidyltransferase
MTVAHIEIPEARICELCRRNGIRRLSLFGSVLTDRLSDTSDIDVLVEFAPEARIGFFRLADIEETAKPVARRPASRPAHSNGLEPVLP